MRIRIANDLALAKDVFRRVILLCPDLEIASVANGSAQAIALAGADQPGLVLMDISMSGTNGVDATR
jgi:DNA-binding NarL/FixJ family response regulator